MTAPDLWSGLSPDNIPTREQLFEELVTINAELDAARTEYNEDAARAVMSHTRFLAAQSAKRLWCERADYVAGSR